MRNCAPLFEIFSGSGTIYNALSARDLPARVAEYEVMMKEVQ